MISVGFLCFKHSADVRMVVSFKIAPAQKDVSISPEMLVIRFTLNANSVRFFKSFRLLSVGTNLASRGFFAFTIQAKVRPKNMKVFMVKWVFQNDTSTDRVKFSLETVWKTSLPKTPNEITKIRSGSSVFCQNI